MRSITTEYFFHAAYDSLVENDHSGVLGKKVLGWPSEKCTHLYRPHVSVSDVLNTNRTLHSPDKY